MKWVEILGFLAGFIANGYFYELLTKIDYQVFLGLYLPKNEPIYKIISIFVFPETSRPNSIPANAAPFVKVPLRNTAFYAQSPNEDAFGLI